MTSPPDHGGQRIARVLARHGVETLFTLCGGHISPILVAAKARGLAVVDVRHEAAHRRLRLSRRTAALLESCARAIERGTDEFLGAVLQRDGEAALRANITQMAPPPWGVPATGPSPQRWLLRWPVP